MTRLDGKTIIVTGAGRGIGQAYARAFARLGAIVVVNDVVPGLAEATAEAIKREGARAFAHAADISNWDEAGGLIEASITTCGRLDGLVNNGGIFRIGRIDEAIDNNDLEDLLRVNVVGTFNCAAHAVSHMKALGSGSIVNVTSGAQMGIPAMGAYGATKGAIAAFTYAWALELADSGVRVNAVSPLAFTEQSHVATAYHAARGRELKRAKLVPPDANAPLVAYLLSDRSKAINGQVVRIEDTQLSLVSHPAVMLPLITRDAWTVDEIASAFDEDLVNRTAALGISGVEIVRSGPASAYWQGTTAT